MAAAPERSARKLLSERGSILIQVGVALIVLIAFLTFVADYGLMWVARRQAQNAADAGALAGAVALGYDNFTNRTATGPAKESAHKVALSHFVAGEVPVVDINADVYFYVGNEDKFPDTCADDTCIRVDVYRNQDEGNPLPIWFGQLIGLVNQGVRATAIAQAAFGNATDCMKPWAVVDRWDEHWENGMPATLPWSWDSLFDKYDKDGNIIPTPGGQPDHYEPASVEYGGDDIDGDMVGDTPDWSTYEPGTGFHPFEFNDDGSYTKTDDYGLPMSLKQGDAGDWTYGAGWFLRLDLCGLINYEAEHQYEPPSNSGADCYRWVIKNCVGTTLKIGQEIPFDNQPGAATGPTRQAVETDGINDGSGPSLINQDPNAKWDPNGGADGEGAVVGSDPKFNGHSPRIVAIPLVDPDALMAAFKNGRTTVPISNIAGFFIEGVQGSGANQTVTGYLMTMPGMKAGGGGGPAPSTFMRTISLIR